MDYEKDVCPYEVGQLFVAKNVLSWVFEQNSQIPNNIHSMTIFDLINDIIMDEIIRQLRIRRLKDYSTSELEAELNLRKGGINNE